MQADRIRFKSSLLRGKLLRNIDFRSSWALVFFRWYLHTIFSIGSQSSLKWSVSAVLRCSHCRGCKLYLSSGDRKVLKCYDSRVSCNVWKNIFDQKSDMTLETASFLNTKYAVTTPQRPSACLWHHVCTYCSFTQYKTHLFYFWYNSDFFFCH